MQYAFAIKQQNHGHILNAFSQEFRGGLNYLKHNAVLEKPAYVIESIVKSFWIVLRQEIK